MKDTRETPVMSLFTFQTFSEPRPYLQETYCPLGETDANPGSTMQCDGVMSDEVETGPGCSGGRGGQTGEGGAGQPGAEHGQEGLLQR